MLVGSRPTDRLGLFTSLPHLSLFVRANSFVSYSTEGCASAAKKPCILSLLSPSCRISSVSIESTQCGRHSTELWECSLGKGLTRNDGVSLLQTISLELSPVRGLNFLFSFLSCSLTFQGCLRADALCLIMFFFLALVHTAGEEGCERLLDEKERASFCRSTTCATQLFTNHVLDVSWFLHDPSRP